jgi:uncharacterized protein YjbI with pentapeptide repeats
MLWQTGFNQVSLKNANLAWLTAFQSRLMRCDMTGAYMEDVRFRFTDISESNLAGAIMTRAEVIASRLRKSDLSGVKLTASMLSGEFEDIRFQHSDFGNAVLRRCRLSGNFEGAMFDQTAFVDVVFRDCTRLEMIEHLGPSQFTLSTILENASLPRAFWESAGVKIPVAQLIEAFEANSSYQSCFISYASKDRVFANDLFTFLRYRGASCWMASASLKIGELQRQAIYSAIRDHRQLLVVISADSVLSRWVENEVERALAKENETKTPCILPIRIDEVALNTDTSWVVALRDTRNIADFTGWGNPILRATLQNDLLAALLAEE